MKTALLFPGQGSQRVGMGRDLAREFPAAQRTFEEADDALGFAISEICWKGPEDRLTLTENTQPAILTNSIAVLRALESEFDLGFDVAAGHSLGELSALVAAGALDFGDAVKLVHLRGKAMQDAVPAGQGGMAAIMGLDLDAVQAVCDQARDDRDDQVCSPANLNGAGQIVISGHAEAVARAVALAQQKGARRALSLQVSAPFHCALMIPAAEALRQALDSIEIHPLQVPVVANVDAQPNQEAARVKGLLVDQVTRPVRWEACVETLARMGVERAYELGSGSVLRGLVRRIAKDLQVTTIGEPHEVRAFQAA
jgi:[acyl-carrier-protein] S-malonyltransferase